MKFNNSVPLNGLKAFERSLSNNGDSFNAISSPNTVTTDCSKSNLIFKQLLEAEIDLDSEIPSAQACLTIIQDGVQSTIGTLGNFSLIIGKPKSRKTFLTSVFMAAALRDKPLQNIIHGSLPSNQKVVLLFDTEQCYYHTSLIGKRVINLSGEVTSENYRVFGLRQFKAKKRLELIEEGIKQIPQVGIVVIDGLRDLVTAINDEEQATLVIEKLLSWSKEYNIHIVGVLHENKQNKDPRGHIGTEAQNKAETVLTVKTDSTANNGQTVVEALYCRDKSFHSFAFTVDDDGLPQLIPKYFKPKKSISNKTLSILPEDVPNNLPKEMLKLIVEITFSIESKFTYKNLKVNLINTLQLVGIEIGDNKTKRLIAYLRENGYIKQTGVLNSSQSFYTKL